MSEGTMLSKSLLYVSSILAALAMATGGSFIPAIAAPAMHIGHDGCTMGDGDGNGQFFADAKVTEVDTNSANGNITYKCTADVPNHTGHAVKYDSENNPVGPGLGCTNSAHDQVTLDWQETISASGHAKLVCHFKS
jgi:hypothetical protein